MDQLDKSILLELTVNARIPVQDLAKKYDLSFNTIKNRISKLSETKIIHRYVVGLSWTMLEAEEILFKITTDGTENIKELFEQIETHPLTHTSSRIKERNYEVHAVISDTKSFFDFKEFLTSINGVTHTEIHRIEWVYPPLPSSTPMAIMGQKVAFSRDQLKVLRCLTNDVRMNITEIAKQTKIPSRRIRKILNKLVLGGGARFTVLMNFSAFNRISLGYTIDFDSAKTTPQEIATWFFTHYPFETWWIRYLIDEPQCSVYLLVPDSIEGAAITRDVRQASFTESLEDFYSQQSIAFTGSMKQKLPMELRLEELLTEAGL